MVRSRRGQSGSRAAVTVLLVGLVIILYLLFLPPADREELLSGVPGSSPGGPGGYVPTPGGPVSGGVMIADKYVGTLRSESGSTQEHNIPSTTVFTRVNTEEVKFIDSLYVKGSAFSNQDAVFTFRADTGAGENYLLTFNVDEAQGPLTIYLNDNLIFERAVTSRSPAPIKLPQEYLRPDNTIRFTTATTGWEFWNSNEYRLRNILVTGEIADFQGATSEQHFTITPEEFERTEKGVLEFVPNCDSRQTGRLSVAVNGKLMYNGFIDCGILTRQDIAKENLNIGDNRIGFTSSEGSYIIDRIKLVTLLEQEEHPTFYFNLPPDMFQQANVFAGRVVLTIRFSEGNTVKRGSIIINGFQDSFSTQNYFYQATLDPNVLIPNANSIQIIPDGTLNIPQLRVEMLG